MKVVFTQSAKSDLEQIGDYIAQDNPTRAVSFVRELRTAALALADTPRVFRSSPATKAAISADGHLATT